MATCESNIEFQLNLENDHFLDISWEIPETKTFEVVPTTELGIKIVFEDGEKLLSNYVN